MTIPSDEAARLRALRAYGLWGPGENTDFNPLTEAGAVMFGAPVCLVSFVGADEQWLRSRYGIDIDKTPRDISFCTHTILSDEPLVVLDAAEDDRFRDNPLVTGAPQIRFYAGVPIVDGAGVRLGAFCIIDTKPRKRFSQADRRMLFHFAQIVARNIAAKSASRSACAVESFADATGLGIITTDGEGHITTWNAGAARLFGHEACDVIGEPVDFIVPERFREQHRVGMLKARHAGSTKLAGRAVEVVALRADGSEFPAEMFLSAWQADGDVVFGAHIQDISARRANEAQLVHRASHDALTGLVNLKGFQDRLSQAMETHETLGLLAIDLDGFKRLNDTLGHAAGDALLQMIAVRMLTQCDKSWTVARLGGDEFAVLVPDSGGIFALRAIAQKILSALDEPLTVDGHRVPIGASIGIAVSPDHAGPATDLLARADLAMFRAKRAGGARWALFDDSMRSAVAARRALEDDLRVAQSSGQWELHYQPQIWLATRSAGGRRSAFAMASPPIRAAFASGLSTRSRQTISSPTTLATGSSTRPAASSRHGDRRGCRSRASA